MRVIAGPEKKTRVMSEKERLVTAYHEVGHAIVGQLLEHTDPVHKISIISRGQALGYTISLPTEDKFLTSRAELTDTMAMTLGGRAAEEIVFGEITTGASNDLEKVTETAKDLLVEHREDLDRISNLLLERETIDAEQFVKLLEGHSAEEVFDAEDDEPAPTEPSPEPERSAGREGPRPLQHPRPGFAGGSAEMRADRPD